MTIEQWIIAILTGILVNIVTGTVTYLFTSRKDRLRFSEEVKKTNASIAEIAVNHLYGSYLGSKRLRYDVLSHLTSLRKGKVEPDVFATLLDGIARSLEQERISMLANIKSWKDFLDEDRDSYKILTQLQSEDSILPDQPIPIMMESNLSEESNRNKKKKNPNKDTSILEKIKSLGQSPQEKMLRALLSGDVEAIKSLKNDTSIMTHGRKGKIVLAGVIGISNDPAAIDMVKEILIEEGNQLEDEEVRILLGILTRVAIANDTEEEAIAIYRRFTDEYLKRDDLPDKQKAWVLNQLQRLYYSLEKYGDAVQIMEQVISIDPSDPSYWHNLATCYKELGDLQNAANAIERAIEMDGENAQLLFTATRIYLEMGNNEKAFEFKQKLKRIDEFKATLLDFEDIANK